MGSHITFVATFWILNGFTFFVTCIMRRGWPHIMMCEMFHDHYKRCKFLCLTKIDPCPSIPYPAIFVSSCWHCVNNWWCLHIKRYCHRRPHSSWFAFTCYSFSWDYNNHDLGEGKFLSWSIFNMFLLLDVEVFKYFHQQVDKFFHQCANMMWEVKGIVSPCLLVLHTLSRQKVSMTL